MIGGLFPGQGSQQVGMGKSFYDEFALFRHTFEEASDALNFNLKKLCFDGPESDLTLTENAQPAILTVSIGCFRVAQEEIGAKVDVTLGHSLGEYSALVAAGALPFPQAVKWVRARGLAMQKAVPAGEGTMAAILGAEVSDVETWCKEATLTAQKNRKENAPICEATQTAYTIACTVEPANINAPGQIVVSGSVDAVQALETLLAEKKIRGVMAKRLNVSAPFHCSLMNPARKVMENLFEENQAQFQTLSLPYIPNRTAIVTGEHTVIPHLLSEQIDHSVLWKQSMETLMNQNSNHGQNCRKAYEFGPGKVLQGLAKRIAKGVNAEFEVIPIFDVETLKGAS